jgi:hypothetical protein
MAAKDSILGSILRAADGALNANPLRKVIPVDSAEIARALRTVWLRSISRPDKAMAAAADFNMQQGQTLMDAWNEAWRRWCGLARPEPAPSGGADKRFAAPEWQDNPVYRRRGRHRLGQGGQYWPHRHRTLDPRSNTRFQPTRLLAMWFVTSQKNGVSALGLQRELGLGSYETAWTWLHKLRRAMVRPGRDLLSGTIEVDETYLGGPEQGT